MATAADVKSQPERTAEKDVERRGSVARTEKGRWERLWPVIACGAGLFSDGYLNNVRPGPTSDTTSQRDKNLAQSIVETGKLLGT